MEHSSTKKNKRISAEELSWYYVQPGFRLITFKQIVYALGWIIFLTALIALFDWHLVFESGWVMLILPIEAIVVVWILLALQPHRQIFYRITPTSVFCEFRSSASALANSYELLLNLLSTLIRRKEPYYFNKHSSRSREFDWDEVVSVHGNPNLHTIVLQAGLRGKMILWTNEDNYSRVLMLVKENLQSVRKNYD